MEIVELSYSKVQTYNRCPWLYHLVVNEKWRSGPTSGQAMGNSLHEALAAYLSKDNIEKSLGRLLEIFDETWVNEGYKTVEETYDAYHKGRQMLQEFFKIDQSRKDDVVATEAEFKTNLDGVSFRGTVDRIDRSPDGTHTIVEYKTQATHWNKDRVDNDLQMTFYAYGVREGFGYKPPKLRFLFLSDGSIIETTRSEKQMNEALTLIQQTAEKIRQKNFDPNHAYCEKCEFQSRCEKVKT